MNTRHRSATLIPLALTAFVALTGFAGGGCGSKDPAARAAKMQRYASAHVEDVLDDLDATDEQRERVKVLEARVLASALPLVEEHVRVKAELQAEWSSAAPNAERVHQIVDERVDAVRKVLHVVAGAALELHQLLTAEQRAELCDHR